MSWHKWSRANINSSLYVCGIPRSQSWQQNTSPSKISAYVHRYTVQNHGMDTMALFQCPRQPKSNKTNLMMWLVFLSCLGLNVISSGRRGASPKPHPSHAHWGGQTCKLLTLCNLISINVTWFHLIAPDFIVFHLISL